MSGTDGSGGAVRVGIDLSPIWRPSIASDTSVAEGVLEGLRALDRDDVSVVVAVDHHAPGDLGPRLDGFDVVRFRGGPRMFTNPSTLHNAYRRAGVASGLYHHFGPLRRSHGSVTLVHDIVHVTDPSAFGPVEARYLDMRKTSVRRSTRILCPSHTTADELVRHGYRPSTDTVDVVTWGATRATGDGDARPPAGLDDPGSPFALCVGRLTERKRVPFAADVVAACPTTPRLVVAGPIDTPAIADELRARPHVQVLGRVADEELEWLYRNAQATLLTSRSEGFGLPLIESLQRGCPVVCNDLPVFREVANGFDGVAFCSGDSVARAAAVLADLVAQDRPTSTAVDETFSWPRAAATIVASLLEAATAHR